MPLVWVTGNSGAGKSTVCALLKSLGELAVDADWQGYNHWVDRTSGQIVADPPYPVPAGWLERFAWRISRAEVEALAARMRDKTAFLCGSAENEADVWDLFDLVVCLVVDNETLQDRLLIRTTNAFGKHPEELSAALGSNDGVEPTYRRLGATIIDGRRPPAEVASAILAAAAKTPQLRGPDIMKRERVTRLIAQPAGMRLMEADSMRYQVVNPATGQLEREFPTATDAEISEVLARAERGYLSWRHTSKAERADILRRVAQLYRDRSSDLGAIITREMGKTTAEAKGELKFTAAIYRYYAEQGPELLKDEPLPSRTPGAAWVRKSPIGPLLGIMPWNYPYYQVARFAAPNLMIGNTIVLKHAPQCPESALAMEQIFRDAGLPADAYINVFATNEQVAAMIADPRISGVSVTGSERAGSAVATQAGEHLKKVVLELGGSDPFIVLDTADLAGVAKAAADARMENAGQACNASKRMIVADGVYDEFIREFTKAMAAQVTGDPTDPATTYGPLSSERAAQNLMDQINDAVSKGATVHTGGHRVDRPGAFVEATVLSGVTPAMRAYTEELFGPAAVVYRVADADEAVELANSSAYGLGGAVFSSDETLALDVADRLEVGMVWINQPEGGGPELPFGGTKRSGVGRELGPLGIDEFVNKKLIHTPPADG